MNAPRDVIDGHFELIERLGSGGMGWVWRARDTVPHREVALEAVRPDAEASDAVRERVMREARAPARFNSPHVVTAHRVIEVDPHQWIARELVPGFSLRPRSGDGALTRVEAARVGRQVLAAALRVAHAAGIRHRDAKPANVLLRPYGTAVLTDLGIAALLSTPVMAGVECTRAGGTCATGGCGARGRLLAVWGDVNTAASVRSSRSCGDRRGVLQAGWPLTAAQCASCGGAVRTRWSLRRR